MRVTASRLRADIYRLLDEVLETGVPLEIERRGRLLRIVPAVSPSKLERLARRDGIVVGDPEDLVHIDWSTEWSAGLPD
jgi:hypothetical protein